MLCGALAVFYPVLHVLGCWGEASPWQEGLQAAAEQQSCPFCLGGRAPSACWSAFALLPPDVLDLKVAFVRTPPGSDLCTRPAEILLGTCCVQSPGRLLGLVSPGAKRAGLSPAPGLWFFVLNTLAVLAGGVQPVLGGDVARVRAGCALRGLGLTLAEEQSPRKNRASPSFQASKKLVAATGQQCLPLAVDVRQPQTIVAAVDEALREFKRIDILVNGELPGLGRGRLAQSVLGRAFCTWAASAASALRCCALGAARQ